MFLLFLPLIVASTSLTLFAGELDRPGEWLYMPIWMVFVAILFFGVLVAQLQQKTLIFNRPNTCKWNIILA